MIEPTLRVRGFEIHKGFLGAGAQAAMIDDLREVMQLGPPFSPDTL